MNEKQGLQSSGEREGSTGYRVDLARFCFCGFKRRKGPWSFFRHGKPGSSLGCFLPLSTNLSVKKTSGVPRPGRVELRSGVPLSGLGTPVVHCLRPRVALRARHLVGTGHTAPLVLCKPTLESMPVLVSHTSAVSRRQGHRFVFLQTAKHIMLVLYSPLRPFPIARAAPPLFAVL